MRLGRKGGEEGGGNGNGGPGRGGAPARIPLADAVFSVLSVPQLRGLTRCGWVGVRARRDAELQAFVQG